MANKEHMRIAKSQGHKRNHKRYVVLAICCIIICTIIMCVYLFMSSMDDSNIITAIDNNVNDANANIIENVSNESDDNQNTNNVSSTSNISKEAATNTETTVTMQIPSNDNNMVDVEVSGTTDDVAIDKKIVQVIGLLASCAGNDAKPDDVAGSDAGMAPTSYYQQFASKPFEKYTPENMPLNSQNLIELYRMSDYASTVYPTLSHREITKIDILGEDGKEDDATYYTARISSKDTMKTGFGSGTNGTVSIMRIGFVNGQAVTAYESEL